jgi:hypothetical protein
MHTGGVGVRVIGLDKFGHNNTIKHENKGPPRFSANLKYPLKIIFPKPPSGFSTSANLRFRHQYPALQKKGILLVVIHNDILKIVI